MNECTARFLWRWSPQLRDFQNRFEEIVSKPLLTLRNERPKLKTTPGTNLGFYDTTE